MHHLIKPIWFSIILGVMFVLILISATVPYWSVLIEAVPMRYTILPIPVISKVVTQGSELKLRVSRCNDENTTLPYEFDRQLRRDDNVITMLPQGSSVVPPGCETVDSLLHIITTNVPPGKYVLEGVSTVHGRYRTDRVSWVTESFMVVAP